MIVAIFLLIGGTVLNILGAILSSISYVIPVQIQTAIAWLFHIPWYLSGILPVDNIILAFTLYLTAWLLVYGVRLVIMGLNLIPGINLSMPGHGGDKDNIGASIAQHRHFKSVMKGRDRIHT